MAFTKGNKLGTGRPLGSPNKEDVNSLRELLKENFSENRIQIKQMLNDMYFNTKSHIDELNKRIAELKLDDKDYTWKLKDYSYARSALLDEFKWLLDLKAKLEPKELKAEVTGIAPKVITVIHNYDGTNRTNSGKTGDSVQSEADNRLPEASK